jgi:hypothetical protein
VGEKVLAGKANLKPSAEDYDWLGSGIYFWADSPERAWDWANDRPGSEKIRRPFVVGAVIYPGLCLNLAYDGAGFREKTHIQLAVRNPAAILHYFRVDTSAFVKSSGKPR